MKRRMQESIQFILTSKSSYYRAPHVKSVSKQEFSYIKNIKTKIFSDGYNVGQVTAILVTPDGQCAPYREDWCYFKKVSGCYSGYMGTKKSPLANPS